MTASALARRRQVRTGQDAEAALEATVFVYRQYRWDAGRRTFRRRQADEGPTALLARAHPKAVGKPGQMRFVAKGAVDWIGLMDMGADERPLPIAFDVKSVQGATSFHVPPKDAHQLAFLQDWQAAGGIAFYLLLDQRVGMGWLLGLNDELAQLGTGERVTFSARADGLPVTHHVPRVSRQILPGTASLGYDFLAAIFPRGA